MIPKPLYITPTLARTLQIKTLIKLLQSQTEYFGKSIIFQHCITYFWEKDSWPSLNVVALRLLVPHAQEQHWQLGEGEILCFCHNFCLELSEKWKKQIKRTGTKHLNTKQICWNFGYLICSLEEMTSTSD